LLQKQRKKSERVQQKSKKEVLAKKQYLSGGNFVFGMDPLQHWTQSSSENVSFPHQPPPIKIDSQRGKVLSFFYERRLEVIK
jgi:hypothetical protein